VRGSPAQEKEVNDLCGGSQSRLSKTAGSEVFDKPRKGWPGGQPRPRGQSYFGLAFDRAAGFLGYRVQIAP
jgi:hypothetical protein